MSRDSREGTGNAFISGMQQDVSLNVKSELSLEKRAVEVGGCDDLN